MKGALLHLVYLALVIFWGLCVLDVGPVDDSGPQWVDVIAYGFFCVGYGSFVTQELIERWQGGDE